MSVTKEMLKQFARPLSVDDITWIVQFNKGKSAPVGKFKIMPYINARTVLERLREDIGIGNYQVKQRPIKVAGEDGFICTIMIRNEYGEWISLEDGSDVSNISQIKGGLSSSLKRTVVHLGLAAELYSFPHVYVEGVADNGAIPNWAYPQIKQLTSDIISGKATGFTHTIKNFNTAKETESQTPTQTTSNNPITKPATPSFFKK